MGGREGEWEEGGEREGDMFIGQSVHTCTESGQFQWYRLVLQC